MNRVYLAVFGSIWVYLAGFTIRRDLVAFLAYLAAFLAYLAELGPRRYLAGFGCIWERGVGCIWQCLAVLGSAWRCLTHGLTVFGSVR